MPRCKGDPSRPVSLIHGPMDCRLSREIVTIPTGGVAHRRRCAAAEEDPAPPATDPPPPKPPAAPPAKPPPPAQTAGGSAASKRACKTADARSDNRNHQIA